MLPELNTIKTRRLKLGIKQLAFAKEAAVSQSLISKLESGKLEPSYAIVKKIFSTLDHLENKEEKTCSDIMSKKIIKISESSDVKRAIDMMKKESISQLPVFNKNLMTGNISESSILSKIYEGMSKEDLFSKKVKDIMSQPFPSVSPDTPISSIIPLLKFSDAIAVFEKSHICGIITKADII